MQDEVNRQPNSVVAAGVILFVLLLATSSISRAEDANVAGEVRKTATSILERNCIECHGGKAIRSGLNLSTRDGLLKGGESGPAVVPGKAKESTLYQRVTHSADPGMPFHRKKLTEEQIAALAAWIDAGAEYDQPLRQRAASETEQWWSLRPLNKPVPPTVTSADAAAWVRTPIDRFIVAKLKTLGLRPSAEADRRTLIRRVMFDLVGLPPTPEEMQSFVSNDAPDAYERLVDRLLASPQYGERWARHWMDTVHYAETHGHDQDRPRPNSWPYRDYLIRSFNDDKPYARFVQEQIAGDVLFPDDPQGLVAMGFLATGPWDESSLRDIREDTIDREIARYLDRDDMVTTAMATLISTTVHCARCHEHKFDPVSQEEYYRLQAVFAGVDKAERAYDADPAVGKKRQALRARKLELPALAARADASLLAADVQSQVDAWERQVADAITGWQILEPESFVSTGGATLTIHADGSILAAGTRPDKDTYTIKAQTTTRVTGVRLEVLADESLPKSGPGRQDNGNLHLNEFRVAVANRNAPGDGDFHPVTLASARADFNQQGWSIDMALDGNPATAWGIYPEVGKSHVAVFEFAEPVESPEGATLAFTLEQLHGGGHLIGRVRLSVTSAPLPLPVQAEILPREIVEILKTPDGGRNGAQRAALAAFVLTLDADRELAALPPLQKVYSATNQFQPDGTFRPTATPRAVNVLKRGDINQPGALAEPGALDCIGGLASRFTISSPDDEGARRAALAKWVTDTRNVLAWRSIVNRIWHYHLGRGIVDTPNDLGRMGALPTHPELLDWLAVTLQESGGSMKQLHRLIVTSAVYRQSSHGDSKFAEIDGDNKYFWRMNRSRLDAESIRDAVLCFSGRLDPTMGGPSVKQFIESPGIHVTPVVDYLGFDVDRAENYRRSVYRFIFRTLPDPFMETLDCADASQLTPVRGTSVTALQALTTLHNKFIVRQSEHIAARLERQAPDSTARIVAAYELILGRAPTPRESELVGNYATKHGWPNAVRMLLNSNEFMFVD